MKDIKIIFLDESGDHSLDKIDPQYPVFVLGGVIFEKEYADTELISEVNAFKTYIFGDENLILHTADISRNRKGFESLVNPVKREEFYKHLNELMRKLHYKIIACAIQKEKHIETYRNLAFDPYNFSLQIIVERFCYELSKREKGIIVAERRGVDLDKKLEIEWEHIKIQGTKHLRPSEIRKKILSFQLMDKTQNVVGLQIADLIVSPIGRYIQGKSNKEDFHIILNKFRKTPAGDFLGAGLVILPKN